MFQENSFLTDEHRNAQENLRLSNAQQQKILNELNEYRRQLEENDSESNNIKKKMQNILQENQHLSDEVRNAQ